MEQGCRSWLEPRWAGIHDLMVRLLGHCTCDEGQAHVFELYTVEGARSAERLSA